MYSGVHMIMPAAVGSVRSAATSLAMPKSTSFATPAWSTMMLAVLKSRWTIPSSWTAFRPRAIWIDTS